GGGGGAPTAKAPSK
nr:Chain D, inhibitor peptide (PEP3) [Staphylococcus aureus]